MLVGPLGESMLALGLRTRDQLNRVLGHAKLPHRIATGYRVVPLLLDKDWLIVAVDKPSPEVRLNALHAYTQIVPVLASKTQMMLAFERLSHDVWSSYVMHRPDFFATST